MKKTDYTEPTLDWLQRQFIKVPFGVLRPAEIELILAYFLRLCSIKRGLLPKNHNFSQNLPNYAYIISIRKDDDRNKFRSHTENTHHSGQKSPH
ncbi:hypothetical protein AGMMS49944_24910 [Spirochaetia bacterium]|nr:hypothetical protein AGMMS49944_24910 [Spirochaetia bacterium]